jgi:Rrf2 family nitric oxide-sensitive transcriptional repressor
MQLTRFTDYSLRTLIYLGLNQDRLVTISEVSEAYKVSENHLMKIVHKLGQNGYIETLRGKGGGLRIARDLESISVGSVVRDTEETMDLAECFDTEIQDCPMLPGCALRAALMAARENFLNTLDTYTIADLIANKRSSEVKVKFAVKKPNKPRKRS